MEIITLREAISRSEQLPPDGILYAYEAEPLGPETVCALATESDWENDDPPGFWIVLDKKMIELLPVDSFQQVMRNANEQRPNTTLVSIIPALQFYVERDAFIDFDFESACEVDAAF